MSALQSGSNLLSLDRDVRHHYELFLSRGQIPPFSIKRPAAQCLANLVSPEIPSPTDLSGEILDANSFLASAVDKNNASSISAYHFFSLFLSYIFREYETAFELSEMCQNAPLDLPVRGVIHINELFYSALAQAAVLLPGSATENDLKPILAAKKKISIYAESSDWNFGHKLEMLSAEIFALKGDHCAAIKAYDAAISKAGQHYFVHEQAIAYERAGMLLNDLETSGARASEYLRNAKKKYEEWGAMRKVKDLTDRHVF